MEYECYFVDDADKLELDFAAVTVLVDYRPMAGCPPSFEDPGWPPYIEILSVALRQIDNDTGTINYDALSAEKQKQIDAWITDCINSEGMAQIEDHELAFLEGEDVYSDEG